MAAGGDSYPGEACLEAAGLGGGDDEGEEEEEVDEESEIVGARLVCDR